MSVTLEDLMRRDFRFLSHATKLLVRSSPENDSAMGEKSLRALTSLMFIKK